MVERVERAAPTEEPDRGAARFIRTIWGEGRGCIMSRSTSGGAPVHRWFDGDPEAAARHALAQDAKGLDCYLSCATFMPGTTSRAADSARAMRALWVDIDCGSGKPYGSPRDGIAGLFAWCGGQAMPRPDAVVLSGNGVHAWWLSDEDVDPVRWKDLAARLKAHALATGLHIDPTVTADAARVLRIPGTHNHKDSANPKPVRLLYGSSEVTE